ncbi:MAG: site-2 protease family protein [Oscillospiraceae bacterium]|nr:site-2 protease family protein [Oscillospiraceae bacterium]
MILDVIKSGNFLPLLYLLPIVVISLTVHELCHGLASYKLGDDTAKQQGRLSLNPLKHIDPVGFLAMLLMGFGWAKPVRVDLRNLKKPKRDFALTAVAGPFSNLILAFVFAIVYVILFYSGLWGTWGSDAMYYAVIVNIGLAVFNMLPFPPLDGSRLVAAFLPDRYYIQFLRLERYGMLVVLALLYIGVLDGFLNAAVTGIFDLFISIAEAPIRAIWQAVF